MRRGKGKIPAFMAIAFVIAALASAAWAGISAGILNSDDYDVDLSVQGSYDGNTAANQVKLGSSQVTLRQDLILGDKNVAGYAADPLYPAKPQAAGGAIFVDEGQTLSIRPATGKSVRGKEGAVSSLRLFGRGTTNLGGTNNKYSFTFVQSGRLNVASKEALGGSEVTLAGGASLGLTENVSALDLTGITLNVMRFDVNGEEKSVSIDTGTMDSNQMTIGKLSQPTKEPGAGGDDILLVKSGSGTLTLTDAPEHTGGTIIEKGTLSLGASPKKSQTIEIKGGATLSTTVQSLETVTVKPHSDSYIGVQRIRTEAKAQLAGAGEAVLSIGGVDDSELMSSPFRVNANLAGVTRPAGAEADLYYVKLLNAPAHGLSASDVTVEGFVPSDFSTSYYSVRTAVDNDNIYAVLSKDLSVVGTIDVTVIRAGSSATARAILGGENGRTVRFELWDANDALIQTKTAVTSAGEAYGEFTGLSNGRYRVIATADGRRPGEREFLIDGTIDDQNAFGVLLYDDPRTLGLVSVALSNNSNAQFPEGVTFKYSFIASGPYIEGEATPDTFFTAKNVEFSENRARALFQIDLGKLAADDGKSYILAAGKIYSIKIDASIATGNIGSGSPASQVDSAGVLPPASQSYSMNIDTEIAGSTIKSSAMIALDNKPIQDGTIVIFSLLDRFGAPVKVPGAGRDYSEWVYAASGSASMKDGFTNVPAGRYVVSISSLDLNLTAYSDQVEIRGGGGGGGGGCDAGWGVFALFAAGVAVVLRRGRLKG